MVALFLFFALASPFLVAERYDISGNAFVLEDGNLRIHGRELRLFGIYIPPTSEDCSFYSIPVTCGPRAVLALEFKIGASFVHCNIMGRNGDDELEARCFVNGDDLSLWMLSRGWAVAMPYAPIEYEVQEKLARRRGVGIWGLPMDRMLPFEELP